MARDAIQLAGQAGAVSFGVDVQQEGLLLEQASRRSTGQSIGRRPHPTHHMERVSLALPCSPASR